MSVKKKKEVVVKFNAILVAMNVETCWVNFQGFSAKVIYTE